MTITKSSIPEHAKLVFKGQAFDTYQWEQTMFDGSVKIFERLKRNDTVDTVAVAEDGEIYVLEEQQPGRDPFYGLVGGTCEDGEEAITTAQRELLEETGLVSDDRHLFGTYRKSSRIEQISYVYIARNCKITQEQNLDVGGEIITIKKVDWKNFLDFVAHPNFRVSEFSLDALRYLYLGKEEELKRRVLGNKTS